jgi:hypothetical protein
MADEHLENVSTVAEPAITPTTTDVRPHPTFTPNSTDAEMNGIETNESFKYATTLQFYDPHAVSGSAGAATTVGKQVKEWLSAMNLRNTHTIIKTKDDQQLKLTEYPDTEEDAYESLKYETFKNNCRNVSVLLSITSTLRFHDIKLSIMDFLKRKNMYMSRHLFKTQKTNIARCGFFVGKHPRDTFRESFRASIEANMAKALQNMDAQEKNEYVKDLTRNADDESQTDNEVNIQECRPTWKYDGKTYSTEALAIFCPREKMYLVMDLISKLFPGTPSDEFDDDPIIKFVPFSTPYNHSIPHAEKAYASLIQEQNQFLQDHVGIPVGGLSYEAMQYAPTDGMALDSTLYYSKLFTALEPTSLVNKTGKWIFCTTRKKATKALAYIETDMTSLYAHVPESHRGKYQMCPTPRRLTRSPLRTAYMINIVTGANTTLIQNPNRNFQRAPKSNAWHHGPPDLRTESENASTASKTTLGSTQMITAMDEHREEVSLNINQMKSSIQMFQTKTDAQFKTLTSQLESQIQQIQLNTTKTRDLIQHSPALSSENLTQLKNNIILELTPVIKSAIDSAMPNLIREHMDASIGPAIFHALAQLNLTPHPSTSQSSYSTTGLSPPRKQAKSNDGTTMDASPSPLAPRTMPPDHPTSPGSDYS